LNFLCFVRTKGLNSVMLVT